MPGPLPKRTEERRRRNAVPGETLVKMAGAVKPAPVPQGLHPIARNWYQSLKTSGQSQYFEPSDWAAAVYVAEVMSKNLNAARFSAQAFAAVWASMEDLMTTEAARRRARLQVLRDLEEELGDDAPTALDEYRKALGQ